MNVLSKSLLMLLLISNLSSCYKKHIILTVPIQRMDYDSIYFQYNYLDSVFKGALPLDISNEDYYSSDSIKIKVSKDDPSNFKFLSIVKRVWHKTDILVSLNTNERVLYGYRSVDQKPLFDHVKFPQENDSAITQFFENYFEDKHQLKKTGIYIIIDGNGNSRYESSQIEDDRILQQIKDAINSLPKFTSPMKDGDTVSVIYLIEVPVPN